MPGFLYRGVHAQHPALPEARLGEVTPGDCHGEIDARTHNLSGVSAISPFTSWTTNLEIARRYAESEGPGGVILRLRRGAPPPDAAWCREWSPDDFWENERLLRGTRRDAEVLLP